MNRVQRTISPFLWALRIAYTANPLLFVIINSITILTSSTSGVITTYILAQTTASVAQLAAGAVTIRTPITWAVVFGGVTLLYDVVRRVLSYFSSKYANSLELSINSLYAHKVSSFTQEQLDDTSLQNKLNISRRELYSVQRASSTVQEIISSIIGYSIAVIVMWQYAWGIAVLLLLLVPTMAINNYYQVKRRRKSWEESTVYWRISSGLHSYITDPIRLFQIKIMGARKKLLDLYTINAKKAFSIELSAERRNILFSLIDDIMSPIIEVGTRVWAIALVAGGRLAFDQFLFVMGLIQQASSQTFTLGYSILDAQETYLATSALKEVMDYPLPADGAMKLSGGENKGGMSIRFQDVSLTYGDGTKALQHITFDIPAGKKVAFVGENGAGKTSILRLLSRQYEPTSGAVLLNGIDTRDIARDSLYTHISMLSQDYYLFYDLTLRQNINVATNKDLPDEALEEVLQKVQMSNKVQSLKHGLDTRLDKSYDDGTDLSGGQMQRLAIARALIKNYQLMILDEPTSAIDAKAERSIFNDIFRDDNPATVLIVSHRFSTVRRADYIFVVHNGGIIEQGTHQELMALNGHYAELYTMQANDFKD